MPTKVNNSVASPLQYIFEDGRIAGQFYNSWDKKYHLAFYEPYKKPPNEYFCGGVGNFAESRVDEGFINRCEKCFGEVK